MEFDGESISIDKTVKSDICIIGAGAAGFVLAKEFNDSAKQVSIVLVESGPKAYNQSTQNLYDGYVGPDGLPHDPLISWRRRFLGGSTNCWGGAVYLWTLLISKLDPILNVVVGLFQLMKSSHFIKEL